MEDIKYFKNGANSKWRILNTSKIAPIQNGGFFTLRLFTSEDGVRFFVYVRLLT